MIGTPGPVGKDGVNGEKGSSGESGAPGPQGFPGPRGTPGMNGNMGETGPKGAPVKLLQTNYTSMSFCYYFEKEKLSDLKRRNSISSNTQKSPLSMQHKNTKKI